MKTNRDQYPLHSVPVRGQTVRHAAYMDARSREAGQTVRTWPYALSCLLLACAGTAMAITGGAA